MFRQQNSNVKRAATKTMNLKYADFEMKTQVERKRSQHVPENRNINEYFIQHNRSKHKPLEMFKNNNVTEERKSNSQERKIGGIPHDIDEDEDDSVSSETVPDKLERSYNLQHNPIRVTFVTKRMTTCQGCDEHLNYEKQKPPYNIVFKWNGFQKRPKCYGSKEWVTDKQQSPCFFQLHDLYYI